ncbi:NB-ARC domain-containing protein [Streptomyces sp. 4N509B]|uniref:WD40 domain-containing protein n=1 Tax=Streptomyces sp. 4N509B TaxID=3457413 RepID=UPI003FD62C6D
MGIRLTVTRRHALLICSLVVLCATLPLWVLTGGDLEYVAGWATVLALPISLLGLAMMFGDNAGGSSNSGGRAQQSRPWMAPPLDRLVDRPELSRRLMEVLTASEASEVGLTTAIRGAGGFGKTSLAAWVCHRDQIKRRYPGGLLWVTLGQEIQRSTLAERINDLSFTLSGQRPALSDPDTAGAELGQLLDNREPVLLVLDDVWSEAHLRPFRIGGRSCTRLVTTRLPDLMPPDQPSVHVDIMTEAQGVAMVRDGVTGLPTLTAVRLADLAGRWPVLLNLVNRALRRQVVQGQNPEQAAGDIARRLEVDGPTTFDPAVSRDRTRAVAATVEASLVLMEQGDQRRFLELAIFPEDVEIPLSILDLLWPGRAEALSENFFSLGLVAALKRDEPGPRLILHDIIRGYLRGRLDGAARAEVHRRLVSSAAAAHLPATESGTREPWWLLPSHEGYLWRYLPWHLQESGSVEALEELVCDLRWVEAKTRLLGSVVPVESDLERAQGTTVSALRRALRQSASLLGPIEPPESLGAILASRLQHVPELAAALDTYRAGLRVPKLEPIWPLADLSVPHDVAEASGHIGGVTACSFSPDGDLLASASDDATVRVWQLADGGQRAVLSGHAGGVWDCSFSSDGTLIATASADRTVRLWRTDTWSPMSVLAGHVDSVRSCCFSADRELLASASDDGTIRLWSVADATERAVLRGHSKSVRSCRFSPDGELLASASDDGTIRLWSVADATERAVLRGHSDSVRSCRFSPDGELLASASDDGTLRLWTVASRAERLQIAIQHDPALSCAFSPDGAVLAATGYGNVRLWNVVDGTEGPSFGGHSMAVWGCAFSPDGALLATAGMDQTVRVRRVADGAASTVFSRGTSRMDGCGFSSDGRLLATAAVDGIARLWRVPEGTLYTSLSGHSDKVTGCAFSPDDELVVTGGNDGTARLWRVADGAEQRVFRGHTAWVRGCAFSPDGTSFVSVSNDRSARLWKLSDGTSTTLVGHTDRVYACAFSRDGRWLATGGADYTARLWAIGADGDVTAAQVLRQHTDLVNACSFSPDGSLLATASDDRTVRLWNVADGSEAAVLRGHTSWVDGCAFSPDGTLLATASSDGTVRVWAVEDGQCRCALRVAAPMVQIAWHPSGGMIGVVGGAGAYLLAYRG